MYNELTVKNIKTFEKEQKLKIAPITLIYGENSSGKTTLLKIFDIVHNIFHSSTIARGNKTAGAINSERGSSEDTKNISARKIHFFSSQINKKPLQIELTLNLPYNHIDQDHPLYSNNISEKYEYFEEYVLPQQGKGKTVSRKTIGTSTYVVDKMPDGSFRKMVIRDTGEGSGKNKKFKMSLLSSSRVYKSKDKVKMVPVKFFIEIKYFPGLKLSKVNKLEIKNINNKTHISFLRVPKQYGFPTDDNVYGYVGNMAKQNIKRHIKENPDFFTSSAGYADYKINIQKENNIWLKTYKKYETIFSSDKKINIRLNKIKLLFQALINYKYVRLLNLKKNRIDDEIKWEGFSSLVASYILGNNQTEYLEMEKTIKSLFHFSDNDTPLQIDFPRDLNLQNIGTLLYEQTGGELLDGDVVWEGLPPELSQKYFISNIIKKHSNAKKYENEIINLCNLFKNANDVDLFVIRKFLNKKVSFKKFCVEGRNSYKDILVRFRRTPSIVGMGGIAEIKHKFVNFHGQERCTNFDILIAFLNYIYGNITNAFFYRNISGSKSEEGMLKRATPHYLINNCLIEIRKTIQGFIPCHPNKAETSYDVPMKEEFDWEEIEKAIGSLYDKVFHYKKFKDYFKSKGMKYKVITVNSSSPNDISLNRRNEDKIVRKLYKNYRISPRVPIGREQVHFSEIGYVADYIVEDKQGKKTVIEVKTIFKKKKKEKDFISLPESISANGDNFDDVICNNKELRQALNKILKPLLNLKLIVVTPEWIKNLPEDTYERLRKGWDRGSFRNLWSLRRKWPRKDKFLMLQDLTFNKFFNIHGREVGKGPSNILPFLAQILSTKPNLTYLIQELENNWHPKNQRKIIEAIVDVMKKSEYKNFVLETHSELFILQVKKLVQKGILKPEEVSINYVSRSKDGSSNVFHIPINSEGAFMKEWPGGFFNERAEILTS